MLQRALKNQYEGLMLRVPDSLYLDGRRHKDAIMKVKRNIDKSFVLDDEFLVVGISASVDGWAILTCETDAGNMFNVSAPGTHQQKEYVYKNRDKYIGRHIRVEFFEYTEKLCKEYAQMNFESTDKAFAQQENNPVIKKNLSEVAKLKDTVRAVMNIVLFEPNGYLNQFFAILGNQFNLSSSVFDNLTQKEILDLFEGKKPIESIVVKRQEAFIESYNLESFYDGKEAEFIVQKFRENAEYSDIFQGQIANKGKITGMVKIIPIDYGNLDRVNVEIERMKQGDILVAETTAPELIVACKKASAIVTDIGGLLSHAAIVARELKIPCIIGTKIATKILKDGDLVEVDANTGVVKILKRVKV
jgi:phosphohistidine swiveling domain-containing protein